MLRNYVTFLLHSSFSMLVNIVFVQHKWISIMIEGKNASRIDSWGHRHLHQLWLQRHQKILAVNWQYFWRHADTVKFLNNHQIPGVVLCLHCLTRRGRARYHMLYINLPPLTIHRTNCPVCQQLSFWDIFMINRLSPSTISIPCLCHQMRPFLHLDSNPQRKPSPKNIFDQRRS